LSVRLHKLSGAGNDFLAWAAPGRDPSPEEVAAWCTRSISIGADGVFVLRPLAPGRVGMRHWNADGSRAELCLNGTRCAARLAFDFGWNDGGTLVLETDAGDATAHRTDDPTVYAIDAPLPDGPPRRLAPEVENEAREGWLLRVGVPHFVLPVEGSLADAPVTSLGPALRAHPDVGPAGANANFVRFPERHRLEIRTWERGVEAETLACGSGVLASVAVGVATGALAFPVTALTLGGFELQVDGEVDASGRIERWTLAGDARRVGAVELTDEASRPAPPPATWSR